MFGFKGLTLDERLRSRTAKTGQVQKTQIRLVDKEKELFSIYFFLFMSIKKCLLIIHYIASTASSNKDIKIKK